MASAWEQRFARYVAALAALRESTALEVLPDLMPVLPVVDPAAPEVRGERGEDLCVQSTSVVGVVGQRSLIGIRNPAGGNLIVVIEKALFQTATAGGVKFCTGAPLGVGAGPIGITRNRRLSRLGGVSALTGVSVASLFTANIANPGSGYNPTWEWLTGYLAATPGAAFDVPFILGPGRDAWFEGTADNMNMTVSFAWSERVCDATEL